MNKVLLMGRLTKDPECRYNGDMAITRYALAVDRRRAKEGEQTADFLNCVAFGKGGEFADKYFRKGMRVAIIGHIQTGSYTNREGQKVYTTDIIVEEQEFADAKRGTDTTETEAQKPEPAKETKQETLGEWMNVPEIDDEGLPFN